MSCPRCHGDKILEIEMADIASMVLDRKCKECHHQFRSEWAINFQREHNLLEKKFAALVGYLQMNFGSSSKAILEKISSMTLED